MSRILAFVYGTLQRGGEYHYLMLKSGGAFIGSAKLTQRYPLVNNGYPCLLDRPGEGTIVPGEVYSLPDNDSWAILDKLEGHPDEYRRRLEPVQIGDITEKAWVYFYVLSDQSV